MNSSPEIKALGRILSFQSQSSAYLLGICIVLNAVSEVVSVAAVYPLGAVTSDPSLVTSNEWLALLHSAFGQPSLANFTLELAGIFLASFALTTLLNGLTLWLQQRYTLELRHRLATHLLRSYLAKDYLWFLDQHTAELSKNVISEVDRLAQELILKLSTILMRGLSAVFLCIGLTMINPIVTIVSATALLLTYRQIYSSFRKTLSDMGGRRMQLNRQRHQFALESLSTVKEARLGARREHLHIPFELSSKAFSQIDIRHRMIAEMPRYLTEGLAIFSIIGIFCYLVSAGQDPRRAFPWMGLYIMATWRLVPNLQELYSSFADVRLNWPVLSRMQLDWKPPAAKETPGINLDNSLELREVEFAYPNSARTAVRGITMAIQAHSLVGLVGKTGSGKTTAADLIAGQLFAQKGQLCVDGVALNRVALEKWQSNIGYVPQSVYLTSDTLRRNIALGLPDWLIDNLAVEQAAKAASLETLITQLPKGLDSILGERGQNLSGGERQRVGIARALYSNPEILIFDEATSSLDNHTESTVMLAIEKLAQHRTVILIAHRLSTVRNCERIFTFQDGTIVSQGTHSELATSCPIYQELLNQKEKSDGV